MRKRSYISCWIAEDIYAATDIFIWHDVLSRGWCQRSHWLNYMRPFIQIAEWKCLCILWIFKFKAFPWLIFQRKMYSTYFISKLIVFLMSIFWTVKCIITQAVLLLSYLRRLQSSVVLFSSWPTHRWKLPHHQTKVTSSTCLGLPSVASGKMKTLCSLLQIHRVTRNIK